MRLEARWVVLVLSLASACTPREEALAIEPSVVSIDVEPVTTFRVRGVPPERAFTSAGGVLALAPDLVVRVGDVAARIVGADGDGIVVRLDGTVPIGTSDLVVAGTAWTMLARDALVVSEAGTADAGVLVADGGASDASAARCSGHCTCTAGDRCAMTCTTPSCVLTCASGAQCEFDCGGGDCTFVCEQGSICTTHCSGACTTQCADGARCN